MRNRLAFALLAITTLVFIACGSDDTVPPTQVNVHLLEYKINSSITSFKADKPYKFVVKNDGSLAHEFMITPRNGGHDMGVMMGIEEDDMGPGRTQTRSFTFQDPGEFEFACHLPNHSEGAMKLRVMVQ